LILSFSHIHVFDMALVAGALVAGALLVGPASENLTVLFASPTP